MNQFYVIQRHIYQTTIFEKAIKQMLSLFFPPSSSHVSLWNLNNIYVWGKYFNAKLIGYRRALSNYTYIIITVLDFCSFYINEDAHVKLNYSRYYFSCLYVIVAMINTGFVTNVLYKRLPPGYLLCAVSSANQLNEQSMTTLCHVQWSIYGQFHKTTKYWNIF